MKRSSLRMDRVDTPIIPTIAAMVRATPGTISLGQGVVSYGPPADAVAALPGLMSDVQLNKYQAVSGYAPLVAEIEAKLARENGLAVGANSAIMVTAGSNMAFLNSVLALADPADEFILPMPYYFNQEMAIRMAGCVPVPVAVRDDWQLDVPALAAAITPRTRAIIINSPHNPSATIWTAEEMRQLEALLAPTDILLISDEVYEHMVFDGAEHQSAARFAGLAARAFIVSSFGKTFHVTGWKVGTVAAPAALTAEFRKVHQFNVFTVNTPMQHGLAAYLQDPTPYLQLPAFYQAKRDLFRQGLEGSRLKLLPSTGSYFQCVDISAVSDLNESDFCQWLTREVGVAAIPLSAFYGDGFDQRVVRFCFAKKDETLRAALERLRKL